MAAAITTELTGATTDDESLQMRPTEITGVAMNGDHAILEEAKSALGTVLSKIAEKPTPAKNGRVHKKGSHRSHHDTCPHYREILLFNTFPNTRKAHRSAFGNEQVLRAEFRKRVPRTVNGTAIGRTMAKTVWRSRTNAHLNALEDTYMHAALVHQVAGEMPADSFDGITFDTSALATREFFTFIPGSKTALTLTCSTEQAEFGARYYAWSVKPVSRIELLGTNKTIPFTPAAWLFLTGKNVLPVPDIDISNAVIHIINGEPTIHIYDNDSSKTTYLQELGVKLPDEEASNSFVFSGNLVLDVTGRHVTDDQQGSHFEWLMRPSRKSDLRRANLVLPYTREALAYITNGKVVLPPDLYKNSRGILTLHKGKPEVTIFDSKGKPTRYFYYTAYPSDELGPAHNTLHSIERRMLPIKTQQLTHPDYQNANLSGKAISVTQDVTCAHYESKGIPELTRVVVTISVAGKPIERRIYSPTETVYDNNTALTSQRGLQLDAIVYTCANPDYSFTYARDNSSQAYSLTDVSLYDPETNTIRPVAISAIDPEFNSALKPAIHDMPENVRCLDIRGLPIEPIVTRPHFVPNWDSLPLAS